VDNHEYSFLVLKSKTQTSYQKKLEITSVLDGYPQNAYSCTHTLSTGSWFVKKV